MLGACAPALACMHALPDPPLRMKGVSSLSERAGFFGAIAHAYPAATAKVGCSE